MCLIYLFFSEILKHMKTAQIPITLQNYCYIIEGHLKTG